MRQLWNKSEIEYLQNNYGVEIKEKLIAHLKRSWSSVQNRALKLGLSREEKFGQREWLPEEDAVLQQVFSEGEKESIIDGLQPWSWNAICRRAEKIGVKRNLSVVHTRRERDNDWTDQEIEYLKQNYSTGSIEEMAKVLKRQWTTILAYASRHDLYRDKNLAYENRQRPDGWSPEEEQYLKENYATQASVEIAKVLNRTQNAVIGKACLLGIAINDEWTEQEKNIIKEHFENADPLDLLDLLPGRTWAAIGECARKQLGLKRKKRIHHSERRMKRLLDKIFPNEEYQDNVWPDWLINPSTGRNLELDRYYPNINLAFEYNGAQHYVACFKSDMEKENARVARQMISDTAKRDVCAQQGIKLMVIKFSDHLTLDNLQRIIMEYSLNMRTE